MTPAVFVNVVPAPQPKKLLAPCASWVLPSMLLSVLLLTVPGPVGALGLGDIELRSGLGQSFHGTIPLLGEDASSVACARIVNANTSDVPMLLDARLNNLYEERRPRLEITTFRKVEEPMVRFDIIAGCGSPIRRTYTIFLDPPLASYAERAESRAASPEPASVRPLLTPSVALTTAPARAPRPVQTARRADNVAAASVRPGTLATVGTPSTQVAAAANPASAPSANSAPAARPAGVVPVAAAAAQPAPSSQPGGAPAAADSAQAVSAEAPAGADVNAQQQRAEELQAEASRLAQQNNVLLAQVRQVNEGLAEQARRDQADSLWIWLGSAAGLIVLLAALSFFWFMRRRAATPAGAGARGDPWWQSVPPTSAAGAAGAGVAGAAVASNESDAEKSVDEFSQVEASVGADERKGSGVVIHKDGVTVEETDMDDALRHFSTSALNRSSGSTGAALYAPHTPMPVFESPPTMPIAAYDPAPGTHLARLKDAESRSKAGDDGSDMGIGHLDFDLELPEMASPADDNVVSTERPESIDFDLELPPAGEDASDPFKKPRT